MVRKRHFLCVASIFGLLFCAVFSAAFSADAPNTIPKRVLVVVFDQMRPEYAEQINRIYS
jgi:hypothetical protein